MVYDVDTGRSLAVVAAAKQRTGGLGPAQARLRHICDEVRGVLREGPVYVALQLCGETVLMPGLQGLAQRIANVFGGATAAIAAYIAGDEQMAATSLAQTKSLDGWPGAGLRVERFRPVPVR